MGADVGSPPIRVLVADDQLPFRKAARAVLGVMPTFELVGEVVSGEEAVSAAAGLAPDLVLMDVYMEGIDGFEATRRILVTRPGTAVILVSSYRESGLDTAAAEVGAIAFLPKEQFGVRALSALWESQAERVAPTGTRGPPSRDG